MGKKKNVSGRIIDIRGKRFGRLSVKYLARTTSSNGNARWICKCRCGKVVEVDSQNIRNGLTRSCGCLRSDKVIEQIKTNQTFVEQMGDEKSLRNENGIFYSSIRKSCRNQTGIIGVSFDKSSKRYIARLRFQGKFVLNKSCKTLAEAAKMRRAAERKYF